MIDKLSKWTARLVFLLTVLSLGLSYQALMEVAATNGLEGWRSWVWPVLIDGALIVFSLAVVVAVLTSAKPWLRWGMVALFTVLTILFNLADVDNLPDNITVYLPFLVAVIPPVALFMSFETLMSIVRQGAKRQDILTKIDNLTIERQTLSDDIDKLVIKRDKLKLQIADKELQLSDTEQQISDTNLTPVDNRQRALELLSEGHTVSEVAEIVGVAEGTIYRYRRNGK